ncbi:MAG: D-glycero-beta-D-manno-heptose-7-phosphate kinase, partial [Candidatus Omnitrophica bacterium]|nr:D-glycero-beta-D-manno-heptose-7-phosphate kinase [Candidatus Omnitrophota bacterium]
MKLNTSRLKRLASSFRKKKILVVGDLILDHHIFGRVERISPEAPVPVVWANRENFVCGGAANVSLNLRSLGAGVSLCGVIGRDLFGKKLFSRMKDNGIDTSLVIKDSQRPTTLKTRILAHNQQVARLDWESIEFLSLKLNTKILNKVKENLSGFDAIIIEDYGKGVVNPDLVGKL